MQNELNGYFCLQIKLRETKLLNIDKIAQFGVNNNFRGRGNSRTSVALNNEARMLEIASNESRDMWQVF